MDEESEYGQYEDDLENWETEQVFQDACREYDDAMSDELEQGAGDPYDAEYDV